MYHLLSDKPLSSSRFICAVLLLLLIAICPLPRSHSDAGINAEPELREKLLRFRVIANSDSPIDQEQKKQVSMELVQLLKPYLSDCRSKQEAVTVLSAQISSIKKAANESAAFYGPDYPVSCAIEPHEFPVKNYGSFTFPAGTYDTLLVTIGDGAGSNWWCVAYPPLCFTDDSFGTIPDDTDAALTRLLSPSVYREISGTAPKSSPSSGFCFRFFPFLNRLFGL